MSIDNSQYRPGDIVNGHQLSADGAAWVPVVEEQRAADEAPRSWFARHKFVTGLGGVVGIVILFAVMGGAGEVDPTALTGSQQEPSAGPAEGLAGDAAAESARELVGEAVEEPVAGPAEEPVREAVEEPVAGPAEEPVGAGPGMTAAQANALRSAEDYLAFAAFSQQGLIDQLSSRVRRPIRCWGRHVGPLRLCSWMSTGTSRRSVPRRSTWSSRDSRGRG